MGLSLLFLLAEFCWLILADNDPNPNFAYDSAYDFQAKIVKLDKKINGWQVVLQPSDLYNFKGKVISYLPLYPEYEQEAILDIHCKLTKPGPLIDARGREFFYDQYLAKDNIRAICQWPQIKIVGQERGVVYHLYRVKKYLWQSLNNNLVEPASSLAKAMLLATSREVPAPVNTAFARVGLSHVIAISGMHLIIIAWLLQAVLIALGLARKSSVWLVFIIILFYLYLTGLPGSAVRATIMLFVVLLGRAFGRPSLSFYSLLWSADIIVLLNPHVLLYDIGWQLSFLAVLGLLCYVKFFNKFLFFIPETLAMREICAVTLAAQVFTTPLIVYYFGIFSIVAPLANLIILPLATITLVLSMLLALFGFWPLLAQTLAWPLFVFLKIMVLVAEYLASWPLAYINLGVLPWFYLLATFIFLGGLTYYLKPYRYE